MNLHDRIEMTQELTMYNRVERTYS